MKTRCTNEGREKFASYGARGITVCDRWLHSFENFLADMGPRPKGTTLGRKDNNRGYEPDNCRWETPIQQARNTRKNLVFTHDGLTLTLPEWAERIGCAYQALYMRLWKCKWSFEKAITTPFRIQPRKKGHDGMIPAAISAAQSSPLPS